MKGLWSLQRSSQLLFALLAVLTISITIVTAQDIVTKGSISGTVVDATGGVMTNVQVSVAGEIDKRSVTTDASGRFEVPNLLPGSYTVKAELTGFKTTTVSNVMVNVGKATSMRLVMQVGNIVEVVEVKAGSE
ncbi:MAG: carboxypeptidase-like regulatory domain-containing protein, partial [Acidobacteriota bacterium]